MNEYTARYSKVLLLGGLFFIVFAIIEGIERISDGARGMQDYYAIAIALSVYGLSQMVRMVRLGVLLGGISLRHLFTLHWYTAAVSVALPFKLGELVRIVEIGWSTRGLAFGLLIVWVERAFDAAVLGGLAALIMMTGAGSAYELLPVMVFIILFLTCTVMLLGVLPENIVRINLYILRKYQGARAISALKSLCRLKSFASAAKAMFQGRVTTLALLSVMIWTLEIYALSIVLPSGRPIADLILLLLGKLGAALAVNRIFAIELNVLDFAVLQMLLVEIIGICCFVYYYRLRVKCARNLE